MNKQNLFITILSLAALVFLALLIYQHYFLLEKTGETSPKLVIYEARKDFVDYSNIKQGKNTRNCYALLGAKWVIPENYAINPSNTNLSESFISSAIYNSAETWDAATRKEIFLNNYTIDYNATFGNYDSKNAIVFQPLNESNIIALTAVWYFSGRIEEFDQVYNTNFNWGDANVTGEIDYSVMDLQDIATHELGHALGLDDIYNETCFSVTMYGYSAYGEISKRTLEKADLVGLKKIYGA